MPVSRRVALGDVLVRLATVDFFVLVFFLRFRRVGGVGVVREHVVLGAEADQFVFAGATEDHVVRVVPFEHVRAAGSLEELDLADVSFFFAGAAVAGDVSRSAAIRNRDVDPVSGIFEFVRAIVKCCG